MASENVRTRAKLQSILAKMARKLSGMNHAESPEMADRAFTTKPVETIEQFKKIIFHVGREKISKRFVIDDWTLFESYPSREGIQHDEKRWKAIGHVEENPNVKATITVTGYGQEEVGSCSYEILVVTDAFIKNEIKIVHGYQPIIITE